MKKFKITYNAPVTLSFALISAAVLLLGYLTGGATTTAFFATYRSPLTNFLTYIRLFTHVLGHASWEHYISNMLLFLLVGPMLEEKYGSKNLLEVILITAFVTGLFNDLFTENGLLGASGVVFAMIILSSITAYHEHEIPLTFIIVVILYLGQEILTGLFVTDEVSQLAHLIGGVAGAALGFFMNSQGVINSHE